MTIPDFQTLMLPLLKLLEDGEEHDLSELNERLGRQFRLASEERRQLLPSGRQPVFANRIGWARTYLKKAGLLEITGTAKVRVTQIGLDTLGDPPERIDTRFLDQFPEFRSWRRTPKRQNEPKLPEGRQKTPPEALEAAYQNLRNILTDELLERLKAAPPEFFEKAVVDLLLAMGYGGEGSSVGQVTGASGDEGIDGIIKQDRLGLDFVYIQAKRWQGNVGRPVVQGFVGSLEGKKAKRGVMINYRRFHQRGKELCLGDSEQRRPCRWKTPCTAHV